ncbi:hypothetical protein FDI14_gp077 [Mycobacterium phage SirDuracell]|uniref:Uncharacterized protein n=24 Tax=Viruses TaxID=10239 RepID=Q857T3_9CAUD|nr:gp79 [Mycobacterium phage Cjw1]YP_002014398.1 hypothetical protein Porky_77 [Mycobacterium phage Porky]YP_002014546.1 hypothetical protein Kostya_78 [Mycobacterium phage Kostya]YP_008051557.1 hypothetical protein PBI_MURPHY_78 [Mycobacterium phage Murphy]YP_008051703.1 hypothetical protein PBI_DUMBO_78 [Mycobacterium phage Dumbo]YP_008052011.1 hypothetical protein PBI_PHRUX_75 [Mycobacterium phage Phrux]YP_008052254.1 hypothetical protein M039_gp080 [Mycobacterium phage Phaux]YP_008409471
MSVDGVAKRGPEKGRIVITLETTIPRAVWPRYKERLGYVSDAIDCLRVDVQDYKDGYISLEELIALADDGGISVQVGK